MSIWSVGGSNPYLTGYFQFVNNVDIVGGNNSIPITEDPTTPLRVFGATLDPADALAAAGKGTIFVVNPAGVPVDGAFGVGYAFSRVGSFRRGAMIVAYQNGAFNQTGLKFFTRASAVTSNEALNGTPALQLGANNEVFIQPGNAGNVTSGSYTPTLTNQLNVAASTPQVSYWTRVGNVVHVTMSVSIDPTAATTQTEIYITLPVPSALASFRQLNGTAARNSNGIALNLVAAIIGETGAGRALLRFYNDADVANREWACTFSYVVV